MKKQLSLFDVIDEWGSEPPKRRESRRKIPGDGRVIYVPKERETQVVVVSSEDMEKLKYLRRKGIEEQKARMER